ncbi:coatomer subunit alpha [Spizellomyces punctatus DAOM BR117]|uniref:Coatomer subunit alpha n=1 Tax=Spizellomyces punctatus (strain DAOM BR117) TaxID=645134 RepID=A0A0L0HKE1_SPIPD|nr:coatomer subunit alpha [Spizellomyces punctatus DAOM BR117]KND01360.1 hypothetical protein SPPG_03173 [Spizellomyces punctatus DAOM BR117]|eukprot:XP_016609399.1 hypothetical protein SPPG_03173 [Spizellomyces punctatus DAOM BR117]
MLSKFETKSNRVKGLAFHPKRPWILAALHNGAIQLWDYKMGTLIDRFDEHEGPVRGIAFHHTQPLFVSGGDDYKIKVWNWKTRRCLFTLNGHIDYIRTVFFHHESPWIISASDDQTIRIWNWQSRNCISILTGHNHYVMCAQFHPKDDLVVSASLDQTIRVWDISGLRKKHAAAPSSITTDYEHRLGAAGQADIFGNTDAMVKYVLEGHDRGVNWATFHPNLPLIVSSSDDRTVKLWRMNETKAWEVDTCRGHYNNVSSVLFHPRQDLIISDSEDKTIRIWDMTKRTALQTFRREHDRFWILAAHPELNLFAAGHDSGLIVFKLERERPAHAVHQNVLYYVKDKFIRSYDFLSSNDVPVITIRRGTTAQTSPPRALSYNPAEHCVLITTPQDGGSYELYNLPRGQGSGESVESKRGVGQSAIFVARNRFAVLDKPGQQIYIKDLKNETVKQFKPTVTVNDIYYAGAKNILLITSTSVVLYDIELRTSVAELTVNGVRYVVWSPDMSMVAFLSKHTIVIANKQLEQLCLIHETIKIKSGAWDEIGVFLYSTLNHIKYALPQGDNGIIRTVEQPVYLTKVKGKNVSCLDRDGKVRAIAIDPTEYRFKLALVRKNYNEVLHLIRTSNLVGQSIIAYLQKKGYPEVALHFVKDNKTRFDLAIECGNLGVALETAKALDREECWQQLAAEALKQGNHQVLEMAYQRVKNFERLSFLYLVTGNVDKLKKMLKIAEMRNDTMSRYHNALYLGDVEEQIRLLKEVGQLPLAYLAAQTHGLTDEAAEILAAAGLDAPPAGIAPGQLLKTPTPILRQQDSNWPHLPVARSFFEEGLLGGAPVASATKVEDQVMKDVAGWEDAEDIDVGARPGLEVENGQIDIDVGGGEGWDFEGDLDIPSAPQGVPSAASETATGFTPPTAGTNFADLWVRNSALAADHAAAGSFETAMQLLNRQIGAVNFASLKPLFLTMWQASKAYMPANVSLAPLSLPLQRQTKKQLPVIPYTLGGLLGKLQEAYAATTNGRFSDALSLFKTILQHIIFTVVEREEEATEIQQLIDTCREYALGSQMEIARRNLNQETDAKRVIELAAYFTHCQLQPAHLQFTLLSAMVSCYRARNLASALVFAQRLLELNPAPGLAQKARNMQAYCAQNNPTDAIQVEYDQHNPFVTCAISYTPIYRNSPSVQCPYCRASYKPEYSGGLCQVCEISQIGATATGLRNML